jgi:GH15 family glucan-1,4-alpha-glucosidase
MTPDGVGEVQDFMPVIEGRPTDRHRLVRKLRVARGTMRFVLDIQPRFDYGRAKHTVEITEHGAVFHSDSMDLTLHSFGRRDPGDPEAAVPEIHGDGLRTSIIMHEGQTAGIVLESNGGQPKAIRPAEVTRLSDDTSRFWRSWLSQCTYQGRWREMVSRSAMTLKLMTYAPTGPMRNPAWFTPRASATAAAGHRAAACAHELVSPPPARATGLSCCPDDR